MWVSEGAWWTNAELVEELGLAEGQRASVEGAFADHVDTIVANIGLLEQREAELASLLHAETLDRNSASIQIESVVLARAELERANSQMTLEMREALTRDQWLRLQAWWMGENEDRVTIPEPRRR
jgi:Spy/CpxP family protein refolding chaperone